MIHRKPSVTENKLLLLYSLKQLGPCTNLQLWQFVAEADLMDYLTFQLSLGEMIKAEQIRSLPHPIGSLYQLDTLGEEVLIYFDQKLPQSRKNFILEQSFSWKERFEQEQHYLSDFYKNPSGTYTLVLSLLEEKDLFFQLSLTLPDRQSCDYYAHTWAEKSVAIYRYTMDLFGKDFIITEKNTPPSSHPDIRITALETGVVFEAWWEEDLEKKLSLHLFLPSSEMAAYFSHQWLKKRETYLLTLHQQLAK